MHQPQLLTNIDRMSFTHTVLSERRFEQFHLFTFKNRRPPSVVLEARLGVVEKRRGPGGPEGLVTLFPEPSSTCPLVENPSRNVPFPCVC